ncbi:hypothetical protein PIB30_024525 [Stylosanthes scabra]|uniref:Uncharacterized protein n=1 Tax=Stylosanthes scabra TaxID=79078 RepID=A0ABU6QA07_9FABA|nr:hypothetical protein [Stylosanthes scabra]
MTASASRATKIFSFVPLPRGISRVYVETSHVQMPVRSPKIERVVFPSFDVNVQQDNDDACDLGGNRSFGDLALAMAGKPQPSSPHFFSCRS